MIEGIIYRYISPSRKSYIGQTTNEKIRREHWNTIGPYSGIKIDRARIKYGIKNFKYEVLIRTKYKTKIKICTIYKCLSGSNKTAGGFIWKYKEN